MNTETRIVATCQRVVDAAGPKQRENAIADLRQIIRQLDQEGDDACQPASETRSDQSSTSQNASATSSQTTHNTSGSASRGTPSRSRTMSTQVTKTSRRPRSAQ